MRLGLVVPLVLWAAWAEAAVEVSAQPTRVVLGRDTSVRIRVLGAKASSLKSFASAGTLAPAAQLNTEIDFTWAPPESHVPAIALLAFWDSDAGAPAPTVLAIPMLGRTDLEADTEPGADVIVEVGGARFGPVKANRKGKVKVPVEVPPGTTSANVLAEAQGRKTSRTVPLEVPPANPLALAVDPNPLPAEGGWLLVLDAETVDPTTLDVRASGGSVEFQASGPNWERLNLRPATGSEHLTATVALPGRDEAHASAEAQVAKPVQPPEAPVVHQRWYPDAAVGVFYGGNANAGLLLEVGGGYWIRNARPRLALELDSGVRSYGFSVDTSGLGQATATAVVVPVEVSARLRAVERGPGMLGVRAAFGLDIFSLTARSLFVTTPVSGGGVVPEGALGIEGTYLAGSWEISAELRGSISSPLSVSGPPRVEVTLDGVALWIGFRYGTP